MKRIVTVILFLFLLSFIGCSRSERKEEPSNHDLVVTLTPTSIPTPTTPPNVMPYAVYYNDQLYLYKGNLDIESIDKSKLTIVGEVTDFVSTSELPSVNFQTNKECLLPTPLFTYQEGETIRLVMEVNGYRQLLTGNQEYTHEYYVFGTQEE